MNTISEIFLWMPVWLVTAWILLSFKILEPDQIAIVYRLGKRRKIVGPGGFGFFLIGLDEVTIVKTIAHQVLVPGRKEQIVRDDATPLAPGQVRPVRIVHSSFENAMFFYVPIDESDPSSEFKRVSRTELEKDTEKWNEFKKQAENDSLQSSLTSEVIAFVEWNLKRDDGNGKDTLEENLYNFRQNVGSVEKANKRIDGTVRSALQDLMGPVTLRNVFDAKEFIQEEVKRRVEVLVGEPEAADEQDAKEIAEGTSADSVRANRRSEAPWGINIVAVRIEDIDPGKTVNKSRAEQAAAISDRLKKIEDAEGTAQATTIQAEANAKAIKETATAKAYEQQKLGEGERDRIKAVAELMENKGARFLAQIEAARDILPEANVIFAPSDMGTIGGILSLGEELKNQKSNRPE